MTGTHRCLLVFPHRFVEVAIRLITAIAFLVSSLSLSIHSVNAQDELDLALIQVRDETIITGDLTTQIVAIFPAVIPQVVVDAGFKINSRIILGEELPAGTKVTITRNGFPYLTDITFTGTQHWVTDLFGYPLSYAAPFDAGYGGDSETYVITFTGNPVPLDTTLTLQSIISRDDFTADLYELESAQFDLVQDVSEPLLALQYVKDDTTITGTLSALTAAFPQTIPSVLINEGYKINSRMTLSETLPTGSKVTITLSVNGSPSFVYVTDVLIPGTQFWVTDLIPDSVPADFDTGYANRVEVYAISITSGGGNIEPFNTTVQIESIISKDDFATLEVLDAITLDVNLPADADAALQYVKDNTTLTGTLDELTAAFPLSIPSPIVEQGYKINSRMTLGEPLPAGSTVTITLSVNGSPSFAYVTNVLIPGTQFWVTDLIPDSVPADFGTVYANRVEVYAISITSGGGNPEPVNTTVQIESIISKDDFVTLEVLDSITLDVGLPADEPAAVQYVKDNTTLTGTLSSLTETYPLSIPSILISKGYKINTLLTLGNALPAGSRVTITLAINGGAPKAYVTNVLVPGTQFWLTDLIPAAVAANFNNDYAGRVEVYAITIHRGDYPVAFDTTLNIRSIISADGFTTRHILAEATLPVHFDDDTAPLLTLTGLTADGDPLPGDPATGFLLETLNDPALSHALQFAPGTAVNEPLPAQYFALYLTDSSLTANDLEIYFNARALPEAQLTYMLGVANGVNPFAYIKGDTLQLLDAFQHDSQSTDIDLQIPDDFPIGAYTLSGSILDLAGNSSPVTLILQVTDGQAGDKPTVRVYPGTDVVGGDDWIPGRLVYLSLDGEPYGSLLPGTNGAIQFENLGVDLVPGMLVKMFDGRFTRAHTIIDMTVTSVDIDRNRVSGTADPGFIKTMAYSYPSYEWKDAVVNSSRVWTVAYEHVDIIPGSYGTIRQFDAMGNSTRIYWDIPVAPYMVVYPQIDLIRGFGFSPGARVNLDIADGDYTDSSIAAANGFVEFPLSGFYDIQPGQLVVLQGGFVTRSHIVNALGITRIDQTTDDVIGTAAPNAVISVAGFDDIGYGSSIDVTADASGNWLADFSGNEDLKVGTYGYVIQTDEDGDYSRADFYITHEVPVLNALNPSFTTKGSGPLTLLISGSGFVEGYSTVYWNDEPRPTTFISATQLSIELSPADLAVAGTATLRVYNDYFDSGMSPQSLSFPVIGFTPAPGAQLAFTTLTFDWDDIPGATRYRIEISLEEDFDPLVLSARTSLSSYTYPAALVDGQQYYWRIQPRYGLTWSGEWSPVLTFFSRFPPAAPMLSAPASKSHTNADDVTLEWLAADRAETYLLQVATNSMFVGKTKYTVPAAELQKVLEGIPEGKYYWRVRGLREIDGAVVKGPWSAVWIFKVDRTAPAAPVLARPKDGAVKESVPAFAWYAASGAKFYIFEYRPAGGTEADWVSSASLSVLSYQPLEMKEGVYEWRVRALDKAGNQSQSLIRTFTLELPWPIS